MSDPKEYTIGWICAISTEYTAAQAFLDEKHPAPEPLSPADNNDYTVGKIGKHKVVIAVLPYGEYGTSSAANVARDMLHSFPNVRIGLMVGIGGGAPSSQHDVRLGDIVVSAPSEGNGGVFQYDFGKTIQNQAFQPTGVLNQPPTALRTVISGLRSEYEIEGHKLEEAIIGVLERKPRLRKKYKRPDPCSDKLYRSEFLHPLGNDASCAVICGDDPAHLVLRPERMDDEDSLAIHYGLIASANQLMKDALIRDKLAAEESVLCFEMEAAGLMNHFSCLVIRGICDYSDSHKNKEWQGYAAMVAAAYARDLLYRLAPTRVENEKRISELFLDINETMSRAEAGLATISSKLNKRDDIEALEWLTKNNQGPYQSDFLKRRQPGTGQWLLQSPEYQRWRTTEKQTLFCSGIPGAGKTILTAIVIEDLTAQCSSDPSIGLAYVYCNFRLQDEQKAEDLLASILKQLTCSVPESVTKLYEQHRDRRTRPSMNELSKALQTVAKRYTTVFVVIDALDECQTVDDCRNVLLSQLFDLQKKCAVKLFATARPIPDITEMFIGEHLSIRAHESDLHKYLEGRILQAESELLQSYKEEIKKIIAEVADGMFLLAQLLFDSIKTKMTLKKVKETLQSLSRGPDAYAQAYEDAKRRIEGQDPEASKLAMNVLMWITCAKRRLSIRELQEALAVEEGQSFLDQENITSYRFIVSVCAGLVAVDEENQVIRLVHYTTQEYLERKQFAWFPDADLRLTTVCVTYLSFDIFEKGYCMTDMKYEMRLEQYPLYEYAAHNWGCHARGAETDTRNLCHAFFESDLKISASVQALAVSQERIQDYFEQDYMIGYSQLGPAMATGLHLAAWFGLSETANSLLEHKATLNSMDTFARTPLSWAAEKGRGIIVKLFLDKGADFDSRDKKDKTPLLWAAHNGHESVVEMLLEKGADIDSRDKEDKTPLFWAAHNEHECVVKMLLEKGADLDLKDDWGRTPLSLAAKSGHESVVEMLLEKGADLDLKDDWGKTPLSLAAQSGHESVVELLLQKGANFDLGDGEGKTPLSWAGRSGHESIVKLLLQKGANFDLGDGEGKTSLTWAAQRGHGSVVELLLEKGAEFDLRDKRGKTPLSMAAESGHESVVKLLLQKGAYFDLKDELGRSPLSRAAGSGHESVVKLLLEKGADLDLGDRIGMTPLSWAVENGHDSVVRLLLERAPAYIDPPGLEMSFYDHFNAYLNAGSMQL
ncbi:ankyrin [Penicillium pulvis]|uniref:ankyrin n=1 Tax=Penicillium pulvis TaxID=1562058 RepID=UPI002547D7B1|nr:ankyrin [Penicillium pulvis]KAJ5805618.1 ankyrin [Penicillium pulvis]